MKSHPTLLSVNVNKVATLRNTRNKNLPDVIQTSLDLIQFGAQGITVHPRPDGRHIKFEDVRKLKEVISVELNVEGYPNKEFMGLMQEVLPVQCTLVPDPPEALTSSAGWNVSEQKEILQVTCAELKKLKIRISVFVNPDISSQDLKILKEMGVDRIELYTEAYADHYGTSKQEEILLQYIQTAQTAQALGLEINAGHDLNLKNLKRLKSAIPFMAEVSIGHALICDALYLGYKQCIQEYLECLK